MRTPTFDQGLQGTATTASRSSRRGCRCSNRRVQIDFMLSSLLTSCTLVFCPSSFPVCLLSHVFQRHNCMRKGFTEKPHAPSCIWTKFMLLRLISCVSGKFKPQGAFDSVSGELVLELSASTSTIGADHELEIQFLVTSKNASFTSDRGVILQMMFTEHGCQENFLIAHPEAWSFMAVKTCPQASTTSMTFRVQAASIAMIIP